MQNFSGKVISQLQSPADRGRLIDNAEPAEGQKDIADHKPNALTGDEAEAAASVGKLQKPNDCDAPIRADGP